MLGYLLFPIGAFVYFNHPAVYERSLKHAMETMSKDINLEHLARFERASSKTEIDKLGSVIEELSGSSSSSSDSNDKGKVSPK